MKPKYPNIYVRLSDTGQGTFAILGKVLHALRTHGVPDEEIKQFHTEAMAGGYKHLLETCRRWVHLTFAGKEGSA